VAACLRNAGQDDVAVIEPRTEHFYQPLWTLVGVGAPDRSENGRTQAKVMPRGLARIKDAVTQIVPDERKLALASGAQVDYDRLVVNPGLQLDWDRVPGMTESIDTANVSSNYRFDLAPKTWKLIMDLFATMGTDSRGSLFQHGITDCPGTCRPSLEGVLRSMRQSAIPFRV
jgi:sulfide:quinone oxidoreductase